MSYSTLRLSTVSVNPEAKRHVRIKQQVDDSTTGNVAKLVAVTVLELYKDNTREDVNLKLRDSIRRTSRNSNEHVVNVLSEQ
jgi:hypothetical protein